MKVTFAFLVNNEINNYVRRLAYDINKEFKTGFYGAQLPPHISLKQPFHITNINEVEEYFDKLASEIEPFDIKIPNLKYWVSEQMGSIFLEVEKNIALTVLHNKINEELSQRFENTEALFDGDEYRFHITIALGGDCPKESYKQFYNKIHKKEVNFTYKVKEIVMFYYDDENYEVGSFMTYKILPLGRG